MVKSESLATLAKALVAAQKEMGVAVKDSKNPFFKSNYADLSAVIDASVPALNKNGIAVLQMPTTLLENGEGKSKSVLRTMLLHESGEFLASDTDIICAKPNDPQAMGSAISYARRYGLQAITVLKAEDDDGEKSMGRSTPAVKVPEKTASVETDTPVTTKEPRRVSFARKATEPKPAVAASGDEI